MQPIESGIYLARYPKRDWWHIIVVIKGIAPYLFYKAWNMSVLDDVTLTSGSSPPDHWVFGPRIEEPEIKEEES